MQVQYILRWLLFLAFQLMSHVAVIRFHSAINYCYLHFVITPNGPQSLLTTSSNAKIFFEHSLQVKMGTEQFRKPNLMKFYSTQASFSYAKDYSSYIIYTFFSLVIITYIASLQYKKRTVRISHYSTGAFRKSSLFPFESVVFILLYSFRMYAHINERGNPNLSTVSAVSFKCIDP